MDGKQTVWKSRAMLLLLSQCITLFGSTLVQMAVVWYVTLLTSSGKWVAAFTVCAYLPQFLISFAAGVWVDRHSRKKLIIGADALIACVTLIMALVMGRIADNNVILGGLLVMSLLRSLGAGIQTPAVNAAIPQLVPDDKIMRFNGLNAAMQSVVQFAAPAAAGALMTVNTLGSILMIDIATAVVGIGLLAAVSMPALPVQREKTSVSGDMKNGIKYVMSHKLIGNVLAVYGIFIFLCVPAGFLSQLFVSRVFGETYWHMTAVELAGFIGMTAGGLLMIIWGGFKSRGTTMVSGLVAFGFLAIGMGLSGYFAVYIILMVVYGVAITMIQTATTTLIQEEVDSSMQGRIFGFLGAMYSGFLPVGMAVFGPMADAMPLNRIMIGSGAALIALSIFAGANMRLTRTRSRG